MTGVINLFFYMPSAEIAAGQRLLNIIGSKVPDKMIIIHRTIHELIRRLRRLEAEPRIAIIFISCRDELGDVIAIADLLLDIPIILILPESNKEMVAKAHSLRPRFLAYSDSDVREVSTVLSRIIEKARKEYNRQYI